MNKSIYTKKFISLLALASLVALFQTGYAAPELKKKPKLTADQVVAKHFEAMGGIAAHKKVKTRRLEMRMSMPGLFENERITTIQKAPDKKRNLILIPGIGETIEICDGKRAWKKEPEQAGRLLAGLELVQALRDARFYGGIEMLTEGDVTYVKRTKNDGKAFHVLKGKYGKGSPWSGLEIQFHFDQRTYLMSRMNTTMQINGAPVAISMMLADYKKADGLPYPSKMTMQFGEGPAGSVPSVQMAVDKITHGIEVDDAIFAIPGKE